MSRDNFNKGHIVEAQDRCYVLSEMITFMLDEHPAIEKAGLQDEIDRIVQLTMNLYQKIGKLEDD